MKTPDTEGAIERVTAFLEHTETHHGQGSLIFCAGKTLKPDDLRAILNHVSRLEEALKTIALARVDDLNRDLARATLNPTEPA